MTRRANGRTSSWHAPVRTFVFFRAEGWYLVEISEDQVIANVESNPGMLLVEDMQGNVIWRPN